MLSKRPISEGRQATKSIFALLLRNKKDILEPHAESIWGARSKGMSPSNETADYWWGRSASSQRKPEDPLMWAIAESSRFFKPPWHQPYSNSKPDGWRSICWDKIIEGGDTEVDDVVKIALDLVDTNSSAVGSSGSHSHQSFFFNCLIADESFWTDSSNTLTLLEGPRIFRWAPWSCYFV